FERRHVSECLAAARAGHLSHHFAKGGSNGERVCERGGERNGYNPVIGQPNGKDLNGRRLCDQRWPAPTSSNKASSYMVSSDAFSNYCIRGERRIASVPKAGRLALGCASCAHRHRAAKCREVHLQGAD